MLIAVKEKMRTAFRSGVFLIRLLSLRAQLQQLDYFAAQFPNFIVLRSQVQGAERVKSALPARLGPCLDQLLRAAMRRPKFCGQAGICRINEYGSSEIIKGCFLDPVVGPALKIVDYAPK